ncbi:MAG TPA: SDR family NAD(P)-dependent oxidoreductase [Frankiaceae bacterium]|jgi:short-subunit dehydrogenase
MQIAAGDVAVVTGAGSGIGRALARALAERGARLALSDISASVDETVAQCTALGAEARGYRLDVADRDAVFAHADQVMADFGQVNLVVNNAGVSVNAPVGELSEKDMQWLMGINFWGVVAGTQAFLPHLEASGKGHLVNISSIFGIIAVPTQAIYNASKYAVRGFSEALREELLMAGSPVGVSVVHPGGVKTGIVAHSRGTAGKDQSREEFAAAFDKIAVTKPAGAARTILRGVERDKARIFVGPDAHALQLLQHLPARVSQRLIARGFGRSM